ncbi:hypothetical protein WICPIJ_001940 [Wickerhamomyces pijperi]|uniref:Uncharacterized protein n=1 Tax=Wickerhamomyces pijperi TaxID=599730 RepID=A0A9P8QAM8_WICPI|nr:hypothetical protein WICPIJ_001940 [Wickerhamomyces pijperi]
MGDVVGFILESVVVETTPFGPGFGQVQINLHSCGEGLVGFILGIHLRKEHTLESEEFGLLLGSKVHQVGVADDIEASVEFIWIHVVTLGLFSQLQESLLDFNVW